jgi:predicted metal-dependent hydrolase
MMSDKPEYTLVRQKRKTVALYIKGGGLEVRAPIKLSKAEIDKFVETKRAWAEKHLAEYAEKTAQKAAFEVNYGNRVPYRGKEWIVGGVPGRKVFFDNAFCVPVHLTPEQIKRACVQIYRLLAKRDLSEKAAEYAAKMSVALGGDFRPTSIKINGAKTRWGSCSAKKSLNFSWRLMMAEDDVIDYVVVHELAHIKEMNHSPKFWAVVAIILPDYKQRQARLKELQKRLATEDWE